MEEKGKKKAVDKCSYNSRRTKFSTPGLIFLQQKFSTPFLLYSWKYHGDISYRRAYRTYTSKILISFATGVESIVYENNMVISH